MTGDMNVISSTNGYHRVGAQVDKNAISFEANSSPDAVFSEQITDDRGVVAYVRPETLEAITERQHNQGYARVRVVPATQNLLEYLNSAR